MWALILFTLHHPVGSNPAVYEWSQDVVAVFKDVSACNGVAAMWNGDTPFEHDNMPYYACEKK